MSRGRPWIAVFIILLVVVGLALTATFWAYWMLNRAPSIDQNTIIEVKLGGGIYEIPPENPLFEILEPTKLSLFDLWEMFELASRDERVSAVGIEIEPLGMSWAQIEELREGMHKFRAAGKKIHAFLAVDLAGENEMYLASAADTISINPDAGLLLNGLMAEVTFYKRSLEKLGIKPEFIQFKEYKSPQQYERSTLSAPVRSMLESIVADMEDRFTKAVAEDRHLDPTVVGTVLDEGMITAAAAVDKGLIDEAGYRSQFLERLKNESGQSKYKAMPAAEYLAGARSGRDNGGKKVALVGGTGTIIAGKGDSLGQTLGGATLSKTLREVRESGDYSAVLFRVNSPGGSAVGSDMIWREVQLLEEAGIPVIVSMSGVAGSGGYYISMAARRIISQPSTITGSIGVIFGKFDLEGFYEWLGVDTERIKSSPNADLFSFSTSLTQEQKAKVVAWMQQVYDTFVSKAAQGRKMEFDQLEPKARGRIYTGDQALEIGLVDEIGGFSTALKSVREALGLPEDAPLNLVRQPEAKSFWEALAELGVVRQRSSLPTLEQLETEVKERTSPGLRLLMPGITIH